MPLAGVDVSRFNGNIDWRVAAHSISFAFAHASTGAHSVDSHFARNWPAMRDAGVTRGAYHRFDPTEDAAMQASLFLRTAALDNADLAPVLDIDLWKRATVEKTIRGIEAWVAAVHAGTGRIPLIYTTPGFWNNLSTPPTIGDCSLWIAHYGVTAPRIPPAWRSWTFWQFSQLGRCAGIEGHVHMNRFNGSTHNLVSQPARMRPSGSR